MSNPLKSPAPVLPAMGLHSFHNDSPPFAGAGTYDHDHPVPEHYSLDGTARRSPQSTLAHSYYPAATGSSPVPASAAAVAADISEDTKVSNTGSGIGIGAGAGQGHNGYPVVPGGAPYTGTRHRPSQPRQVSSASSASAPESDSANGSGRIHTRVTTAEDAQQSERRSRRLMTGYHFGHPRSQSAERGSGGSVKDENSVHGSDSPPLTEAEVDPEPEDELDREQDGEQDPAQSAVNDEQAEEQDVAGHLAELQLGDRRGSTATAIQQVGSGSRRRNSRLRDKETGYDRLNGMGDGEADLDETAPQGPGGTEEYLNGQREYSFPKHRLRTTMKDESKIPVVIVACGSFSPPTYLHLRMFEMAKDEIVESQTYEIMAGYYSPVSSYYKKAGLAPAMDRVRMCELAVEHTSTWLMVDPWEAGQPEYQRTAVVLDHFDEMLNGTEGRGGLVMSDGKRRKYKVMLLAGGDLIESFGEPGVWAEPDLHIILGRFGCLIVERAGSDVWAFLLSHDILYHHRRNVIVIKQLIYNDISSTKVRLFVRRGMSIKYLLPNSVIQYIYDNKLYRNQDVKAVKPA